MSAPTPLERYTHGHHAAIVASHAQRTAENSAGFLLPYLERGQRLLDVGCGPGSITVDLAELVAPGPVVGVDREPAVLEGARRLGEERGLTNLTFEPADVYALPYPDDHVDVVYAHQVLQHLVDPVAALTEMRRVLRPGGVLAVRDSDYATMTHAPHEPPPRPLARALPPGGPLERGRGRRRPPPQGLDAGRGLSGAVRHRQRLVTPGTRPVARRGPSSGPCASPRAPSRNRPARRACRRRRSWPTWPPRGAAGPASRALLRLPARRGPGPEARLTTCCGRRRAAGPAQPACHRT